MNRLISILRRRRVAASLQIAGLAVLLGFLGYATRDVWDDAAPRLRDASMLDLGIAQQKERVRWLKQMVKESRASRRRAA